jgi:hypothetical protein
MIYFKHIQIILVLCLVFLCLTHTTYAYLDPGTGSYVFQLMIAGLLGSMFFLKSIFKKIKSKFKNLRNIDDHEKD